MLDPYVLGAGWEADLVARLHASDRGEEVASLLDAFFLDRLPSPHADEGEAAHVAAALKVYGLSLTETAALLGLSRWQVAGVSDRYIGHVPTLVRRRARFLRALVPALMDGHPLPDVPPGYDDASDIDRDAHAFLTMGAPRLQALPMPYLRAVLRARTAVIGAPLPLLDGA